MRNELMKLAAAVLGSLLLSPAFAQDEKDKVSKDKGKKEMEQIIIRRSDDSQKMVIEINGDKITVNGQPVEALKDGEVSVSRHKIKDALTYFRSPGANGDVYRFLTEEANHAMLGVSTEKAEGGVRIKAISEESAAEKIGLKEGDIILKIDDAKVEDPDGLSRLIRAKKPGDKVVVTYMRDNKQQTATAELTKWKSNFKFDIGDMDFTMPKIDVPRADVMPRMGQAWNYSPGAPKLGLSVQDTDDGKGVKVIEVDEDSNAAKAGVKENDIIKEIDGKAVNTTDEVVKMIRESREKNAITLKIDRGGKTQTIEVKMPKRIKTADL